MSDDARRQIAEINIRFAEAYARGDFEAVAAMYTEQALFLPTDRPPARGRKQIRDTYAAFARAGVRRMQFETLEIQDHGAIVLELAMSTSYMDAGVIARNLYVIAWRQGPDGLQLHWDITASSALEGDSSSQSESRRLMAE